ncbi:hypothetical protein ACVXZ4_03060 [Lacisediminihabitans sp. FW035]
MRSLENDLARSGDLARVGFLRALGHSARTLSAARRSGRVYSPRRGWVASARASPAAVRAVALGGRLGGASALESYGIWAGHRPGLVVAVVPGTSRLPPISPGESRVWAHDRFPMHGDRMFRVSVRDAIIQHARVAHCGELIATLDSALHHGLLGEFELAELLLALPERVRPSAGELDASAMAGTESLMRVALRAQGYRVRTQASIRFVGLVDLLVDDWYIVECDSREFHDGDSQQDTYRRRDGEATLARYGSARFTYSQVMFHREWCLSVVAAGLAAGRP